MADRRTTLLQCSLKIRRGRKWKTRCCTLTKLSPVSDQVVLKFFKDEQHYEAGKDLSREKVIISANNFCSLSSAFRYPKNPYVLTVICLEQVILLSFINHGDLLDWYHKIQNTLPSAAEFQTNVIIPNQQSKLTPGQAILHFYDNHFAITPAVPERLSGSWSLTDLHRYTVQEDCLFFSAITAKGEKTYILVTKDEETSQSLKAHFDIASSVSHEINRFSHISNTVSIHEESVAKDPQEFDNLLGYHGGGGRGPTNGGALGPQHKRNKEEYESKVKTSALVDYYKRRSGLPDNKQSAKGLLVESGIEESSPSTSSYASPSNSRHHSFSTRNGKSKEVLELKNIWHLTELDKGTINPDEVFGYWEPPSSSPLENGAPICFHGKSKETSFTFAASERPSLPIREQNYEIMASFEHIRTTQTNQIRCEDTTDDDNGCSACLSGTPPILAPLSQGEPSESEDKQYDGYVNLFTRRRSAQMALGQSFTPELPPLQIPSMHSSGARTTSNTPTFLPKTQFVNINDLIAANPSYFTNLYPKAEQKEPEEPAVPAPFEHDSLVKPSGPIAMLKQSSSSSSCSSSPTCSGDESGSDHEGGSGGNKTEDMRLKQSDDRPSTSGTPGNKDHNIPGTSLQVAEKQQKEFPSDEDSEIPPPIPPRPEPSLPPPIRKRCYTESGSYYAEEARTRYDVRRGPSNNNEAENDGYLMMKPAYNDKLQAMHRRSRSLASASPLDMTYPTSPLGPSSRRLHSITGRVGGSSNRVGGSSSRMGGSSSSNASFNARLDGKPHQLKRSATIASNLVKQNQCSLHRTRTLSSTSHAAFWKGSLSTSSQGKTFQSSSGSFSGHMPRPRNSRDYASIDTHAIALKMAQEQRKLPNNTKKFDFLDTPQIDEYSELETDFLDNYYYLNSPHSASSGTNTPASRSRTSSAASQSKLGQKVLSDLETSELYSNHESKEGESDLSVQDGTHDNR